VKYLDRWLGGTSSDPISPQHLDAPMMSPLTNGQDISLIQTNGFR